MLLALDTATNVPSIALYDERGVMGETTWRTHENHTRSLIPEITRLMELLGANVIDVRAIAVATGPGSFTGLRIGLSAAKGLAYSLNAALVGVPTLDIMASACLAQTLSVCAVILAGRGRYAVAMYENENGAPVRTSEYFFGTAEAIARQLSQIAAARFFVAGEIEEILHEQMNSTFGDRVVFAAEPMNVRRAGYLAALAWQKWQAGQSDDLQTLAPYYIPTASLA